MSSQFTQRRECRAAAFQYLYAWSVNQPSSMSSDLDLFFQHLEKPRDHYAFAEELIHGTIDHLQEIDSHIKSLAHNWEFDRVARIDLAILRVNFRPALPEDVVRARTHLDAAVAMVAAEHDVGIEVHGSFNRPPKPIDAGAEAPLSA